MTFHIADIGAPPPTIGDGGLAVYVIGPVVIVGSALNFFLQYVPITVTTTGGFLILVYYALGIWKDSTIQTGLNRWQARRKARKIRKIRARQKILDAKLEALQVVKLARIEASEKVQAATIEAKNALAAEDVEALAD